MQRSVRWTCWLNAWLNGHASSDDARDAVFGTDAAHDVLGLSPGTSHPLLLAWGELRSRGVSGAQLVLPEPGDLHGLGGPPSFNELATDAGEAVILAGADIGVVPEVVGRGVFWHVHPARPGVGLDQIADAERHLREELVRVARELVDLDIARWQPEIRLALSEVREDAAPPLAPGYAPRATRVAVLANRCQAISELGSSSETGAVSSFELRTVTQNLSQLSRAARHALVAACSQGLQR